MERAYLWRSIALDCLLCRRRIQLLLRGVWGGFMRCGKAFYHGIYPQDNSPQPTKHFLRGFPIAV